MDVEACCSDVNIESDGFFSLENLNMCEGSGTETEEGGNEVTNTGSTPATPKEPSSSSPTCKASEDCMEDEHYCSSNTGICLPYANCIDDSDCQNPDNSYPVAEFVCEDPTVEYMACNDGQCNKICIDERSEGSSAASLYTVTASLAMAFASLLVRR